MKFTAKLSGLMSGLQPVIAVSQVGVKSEYPDEGKLSIKVTSNGILAEAHNGNVAINSLMSDQTDLDFVYGGSDGNITVDSKDLAATLASFDKGEILNVTLNGTELTFVPQSDPEKLQTIPSEMREIEMPMVATAFSKETKINKAALIEATDRTLFAIGFEKFREAFFYWKLILSPKKMRLVCGDGGRFPIYDIEGDNLSDATSDTVYLIYKDQNPAFIKVLKMVDSDTITIKEYNRDNDASQVGDQFVIVMGSVSLVLIGHNPSVQWPDESQFTARRNSFKFVTRAADWKKEMSGILATYNEAVRSINKVHTTLLTFDSKKNIITLKAENAMRSVRKVKMLDSEIDQDQPDTVEFKVESTVLRDALDQADGNVQMELFPGNKPDKGETMRCTKPMICKYFAADKVGPGPFEKVNSAAGTKEQYVIAFGAYKK